MVLAKTLALGNAMLRKKRKKEIIEDSFNKLSFGDNEEKPDWFVED